MPTDNMPIARYTSADIATTLEVFANKPQVWPELRKSFGQGILTFDLISTLKGADKFVGSETFEVHEELPPFRTLKIGDTVSGGATTGALITFNLDATADVDTYYHYYPRVGQSFWAGCANLMVEMVIMSVTATGDVNGATITAYKKNSLANTGWHPADYIKTGQVFPLSPAVNAGEGTAATTPTHTGYQHFDYYTQVLKDALGFENAEFARERFVEYEGIGLYNHEVARMDMNLDAAMESSIMFGNKTSNILIVQTSLADSTSAKVYGTQGIWDWNTERGYTIDYTDATDFIIEHFYELAEFGESVGLPASTWLFDSGGDLLRRIEKSCKSYITNATGSLNEMFTPDAGGGMKDLTVGFKHIMIGGQTVVLKPNYIMNNPYLFGISTLGLKDAAAVYPIGLAREGKTGEMIPNLQLIYRGLGNFKDRKRAFAPFLGVGGPKGMFGSPTVLEGDISKIHALVDFGLVYLDSWKGVRVVNTSYTGTV
ncbi:MAG: hypothetical protein KKD44_25890 [Proteobacteria bacterium]|nr:hypothetical protein [Pseudomonadota bacterium]MBU1173008.1 hypothetical protein [Pseudomonadota bacterium]